MAVMTSDLSRNSMDLLGRLVLPEGPVNIPSGPNSPRPHHESPLLSASLAAPMPEMVYVLVCKERFQIFSAR